MARKKKAAKKRKQQENQGQPEAKKQKATKPTGKKRFILNFKLKSRSVLRKISAPEDM